MQLTIDDLCKLLGLSDKNDRLHVNGLINVYVTQGKVKCIGNAQRGKDAKGKPPKLYDVPDALIEGMKK